MVDDYFVYALCILLMSVLSISVSLYETRKVSLLHLDITDDDDVWVWPAEDSIQYLSVLERHSTAKQHSSQHGPAAHQRYSAQKLRRWVCDSSSVNVLQLQKMNV